MKLSQAFRLSPLPALYNTSPKFIEFVAGSEGIALVGAGGKTTALFQLAQELKPPVIVTATAHLHIDQIKLADSHWIGIRTGDLTTMEENLRGVMLVTGPIDGDRTSALDGNSILRLRAVCTRHALPLLVESDGSRQHPLKAPADYEPSIPEFVKMVVVVAGLSGLGKPLTDGFVHRPEIFARLGGLKIGDIITSEALVRVLTHPEGGLKNIPSLARRVILLNQADTPEAQAQGKLLSEELVPTYDAAIIASLHPQSSKDNLPPKIHAVHEPIAGIVLAAGESKRFGRTKQLLEWHGKPFVRNVTETALAAGLSPVLVVTGANADAVVASLEHLPITIIHNPDWQNGQSSSIKAGLQALPMETGATLFLLADQPQITPPVIRALIERHTLDLHPIIAPMVADRRANPVLFDRVTYPDLMALTGDVGGRALFSKFTVRYVPWQDESLLVDIDTPEDLEKFRNVD